MRSMYASTIYVALAAMAVMSIVMTSGNAQSKFAPTLELAVTYRDFTPEHPDFECCMEAEERGIVKNQLGPDGTPEYASPGECWVSSGQCGTTSNGRTTHGVKNFYDWYHDTSGPGIRGTYRRTLTLNLVDENRGIYDYTNFHFFPLNDLGASFPDRNELVGGKPRLFEEGPYFYDYNVKDQNYHFTTHLQASFIHVPGAEFTFFGDDDVFVYINKTLVLDLGGVHKLVTGNVKLDQLQLIAGQSYQLDVFHAERHSTHSNFKMTTSMCFDTCPGGPCKPLETPCRQRSTGNPCTKYVCWTEAVAKKKRSLMAVSQFGFGMEGCVEVPNEEGPSSCWVVPSQR